MWCDGTTDCPDGEDESSCTDIKCPGLLRCRHDDLCVHPVDICDGQTHCLLSRDDEMFCNMTKCPEMCKCRGSAIRCQNVLPDITKLSSKLTYIALLELNIAYNFQLQSIRTLQYLKITDSCFERNSMPVKIFHKVNTLYSLVLSSNNILYISQNTFKTLKNVRYIDLVGNHIRQLEELSFEGLQLISSFDLSRLFISVIEDYAFSGLRQLEHLNLSSNLLESLSLSSFAHLTTLTMVDLTNNSILHIHRLTFLNIPRSAYVRFSYPVYCCYLSNNQVCIIQTANKSDHENQKVCLNIVEAQPTKVAYVTLSSICIITSVVIAIKSHTRKLTTHTLLLNYLAILNSVSLLYGLVLSITLISNDGDYMFITVLWPVHYVCHALQFIEYASLLLSQYTVLLISINRLLATRFVFRRRPLTKRQGIAYSIVGWVVVIAIATLVNMSTDVQTPHHSCFPMMTSSNIALTYRYDIWMYIAVSTAITIALPGIYISIARYVYHTKGKVRKTGGEGTIRSIIEKTVLITAVQWITWLSVLMLLLCQSVSLAAVDATDHVYFVALFHGISHSLDELHTLRKCFNLKRT